MRKLKVVGTGASLPARVLTNADLERMVETSDEWITSRTGIKERRIADESTATSDLVIEAGKKALESAGMEPGDLDAIIVATVTPDMFYPSTASWVQKGLGTRKIPAFDLSAACSGFLYGLEVAGSALADLRSGLTNDIRQDLSELIVSEMGMIQLFGTDFLVDGQPMSSGVIAPLPGQVRTGEISGIFEHGNPFHVPFRVEDEGVIRLVPEPTTGLLLVVALLLALAREPFGLACVAQPSAAPSGWSRAIGFTRTKRVPPTTSRRG